MHLNRSAGWKGFKHLNIKHHFYTQHLQNGNCNFDILYQKSRVSRNRIKNKMRADNKNNVVKVEMAPMSIVSVSHNVFKRCRQIKCHLYLGTGLNIKIFLNRINFKKWRQKQIWKENTSRNVQKWAWHKLRKCVPFLKRTWRIK